MNYRIPRLALLVVLLVSMVGVFHGSGAIPRFVLAQNDPCENLKGLHDSEETPLADVGVGSTDAQGENYIVESVFQVSDNGDPSIAQTLIQLSLYQNGEVSVFPNGTAIIRVDSGSVVLQNCSDGKVMSVQLPGSPELVSVEPGQSQEVEQGGAILVNTGDIYYVTDKTEGDVEASPAAAIQQLSNNLAVDTLPAAQPSVGSRLSIGIVQPFKLCSKGGC